MLISVADYERAAGELMEPAALGFFDGGAGDERTLRENVAGFARRRLRPRVLVDVSSVSTATTVLGSDVSMPILVAPVALQGLAHAEGEAAAARAAAAAGTVYCLSSIATSRPSEVAAAAPPGPRWFQLYAFRDRAITEALCEEAVAHGFGAVVLTVDAPIGGRRERDVRTGFATPAGLSIPAVDAAVGSGVPITVPELFTLIDASLTWRTLGELVESLSVPVILKGVQTAEDALLACEHGASAIIVSNHGGRQLDGVAATIDMLEEVVDAVEGRIEVYVDGGIRRATDVLIALALGARAVLIGRPMLWGLATDGEKGVRAVLEILRAELETGLALLGTPTPADVTRAHVWP